ncbi:MAG: D-alanyl-D-alanine carboxypeptidase/D-alanyl-D-alanine-endopeptidase [Pyrinomonadaceae bacterium]
MKRLLLILLLLVNCALSVHAQQTDQRLQSSLVERIERILQRPEFKHALFGIDFYSLDSEQPLYTLNADKLFVPGSTTKLLTEGTALELLGGDFQFHTRVYRTGAISANGTLAGNLVLVASGDPNLSARVTADGTLSWENEDHSYDGDPATRAVPGDPLVIIRKLAQQIADAHIKKVTGHVIIDTSLFPEGQRELGTHVVMSPIIINDNIVDVTIGPGPSENAPVTIRQSPATSYVRFVNNAKTGDPKSRPDVDWGSDLLNADGSHTVTVTGTFPTGTSPILYKYSVPAPSRFAEFVMVEALRNTGITIELNPSDAKDDNRTLSLPYLPEKLIAEHVSPKLKEEVKVTLKVSQNLHASITPMILSAILSPTNRSRNGFDLEREFLQKAGLDLSGASQGDGAGGNAHFSPAFMVSFLSFMSKQKDYSDFYAALPILGRDGTLFDIQSNSTAAGHVHAKTGTFGIYDPLNRKLLITGKGLAGYMTTATGRRLAFAIYVNNVSVNSDSTEIKKVVGQALGEIAAAAYDAAP